MGPICDICDKALGWTPHEHVCDPEKIREHVHELRTRAAVAENRLNSVQDAIFKLLEPLPSLNDETVTVKSEWLRKLWESAQCQWHEAKTADSFLVRWMALHRILCEAFDLFRSKKYGKTQTLLEKLKDLREACDKAKETLGYQDSKLDMTPEDLAVKEIGSP